MEHPWIRGKTAPKDSMLHSPGRIHLTPAGPGFPAGAGAGTPGRVRQPSPSNQQRAAANRTQMHQMMSNRVRANSAPRNPLQLVRKKSI